MINVSRLFYARQGLHCRCGYVDSLPIKLTTCAWLFPHCAYILRRIQMMLSKDSNVYEMLLA